MLDVLALQRLYNIRIKKHNLNGARGMCLKDKDGYLVLIADNLAPKAEEKATDHEFLHIFLGHFDEHADKTTEQKEFEVNNILEELYK